MKPFLLPVLCLLFLVSCKKDDTMSQPKGRVQLRFSHTIGSQPLSFQTTFFTSAGEEFQLTRLKYYISQIRLIDSTGAAFSLPSDYFLIDQSNSASQAIDLQVQQGRYRSIRFLVGVDSTRNVSGAQTGALDPVNDMFWTWNSGYIMAKLEGTSTLSTLPGSRIEYHIGGFKGPESALRTVTLPFPQAYPVTEGKTLELRISADLLKWFSAIHDLRITTNPVCTTPGLLASRYADNYATMFSLTQVQVQ